MKTEYIPRLKVKYENDVILHLTKVLDIKNEAPSYIKVEHKHLNTIIQGDSSGPLNTSASGGKNVKPGQSLFLDNENSGDNAYGSEFLLTGLVGQDQLHVKGHTDVFGKRAIGGVNLWNLRGEEFETEIRLITKVQLLSAKDKLQTYQGAERASAIDTHNELNMFRQDARNAYRQQRR